MSPRLLTILLVLAVLPVHAQEVQQAVHRFDEGNQLFRQGDFEAALSRYREAEAAGYTSGALYYNMGNAYFRLDEVGQAIRYYEKARRWMPESSELEHNVMMARERTVDSFSRMPAPFWRPAWNWIVHILSPTGLYLLGLVFYAALIGAVAVRILRGRSPWLRRTMLVSGALAACFLILAFSASYERDHNVRAVVLNDAVTLLDQPNGSSADVQVHEGTVVDVVTTQAEWSEIRLPNGVRGWMRTETYGTI